MEATPGREGRDYPRPPALRVSHSHVLGRALGELLCETQLSLQVLETFHPHHLLPAPDAVALDWLEPRSPARSFLRMERCGH